MGCYDLGKIDYRLGKNIQILHSPKHPFCYGYGFDMIFYGIIYEYFLIFLQNEDNKSLSDITGFFVYSKNNQSLLLDEVTK